MVPHCLHYHLNHPLFPLSPWKNCLPWNWSLLPKGLGTSGLHYARKVLVTQSCLTLQPHGLYAARLFCPWNSPDKTTRVGSHFLLWEMIPAQGSNLGLLHCRHILYHLSHQGSPHYSITITFKCAGKPKNSCDSHCCNIHFISVIWNWTYLQHAWCIPE